MMNYDESCSEGYFGNPMIRDTYRCSSYYKAENCQAKLQRDRLEAGKRNFQEFSRKTRFSEKSN